MGRGGEGGRVGALLINKEEQSASTSVTGAGGRVRYALEKTQRWEYGGLLEGDYFARLICLTSIPRERRCAMA